MGREPKGLRPFLYLLRLALRGIGDNGAELRGLDRFVDKAVSASSRVQTIEFVFHLAGEDRCLIRAATHRRPGCGY